VQLTGQAYRQLLPHGKFIISLSRRKVRHPGRWQSGISLPGGIHIDVGDFVSIELESERPYDRFAEHRQKYSSGKWKKKKNKPFKNK